MGLRPGLDTFYLIPGKVREQVLDPAWSCCLLEVTQSQSATAHGKGLKVSTKEVLITKGAVHRPSRP